MSAQCSLHVGKEVVMSRRKIENFAFLQEIVNKLKILNPYKVILFGSVASGRQGKDSDLDITVILDSEEVVPTAEEKVEQKVRVRKSVYELSKQTPIDLIVYTKAEYEILSQNDSAFIEEIENNGIVLYEKADRILA